MYTIGFQQAWADVLTFVPRFIGFLAILLIGWLVAWLVGKALDRGLARVGFNRLVERGALRTAMESSGYTASGILGIVGFWTVMLITLQLAFGVFGPNPISALLTRLIAFLPNILVAMVIVIVAATIASAVKTIVQAALSALSYGRVLADVAAVAVLVLGVFAALDQLGIAPAIINGLFYALLAVVVGSAIVAIGGGGIAPMRSVWERTMARVEQEVPNVQQQVQASRASLHLEQMESDQPVVQEVPERRAM